MLFNSVNFLIFFIIVAICYWALSHRFRWIILLVSSIFFYGTFIPKYIAVLAFSILLNYFFGLWIDKSSDDKKGARLQLLGIIVNLVLLAGFKYFNSISLLFNPWFASGADQNSTFVKIIVPLGISFYTFSNISYLIEIKRRKVTSEKHLGYFTCYVSFFPKLLQGPIERPQNFLNQFREKHVLNYDMVTSGLRLMVWGYFKKLVIADRLAYTVNTVFADPSKYTGPSFIIATLFYAFQIYADFSGFIDIARGAARILGFNLQVNFDRPYTSKTIKEFWTRWHISFSTWLRDYIFLPFAYFLSRKLKKERYLGIKTDNLLYSVSITLTFLICGIWHGVGWNFLIWGGLFAIFLVVAHFTGKKKKRFYKKIGIQSNNWVYVWFQTFITFILVSFTWIFFRANNILDAYYIITHLFTGMTNIVNPENLNFIINNLGLSKNQILIILFSISLMGFIQYIFSNTILRTRFLINKAWLRWIGYYIIIVSIIVFGVYNQSSFIYFQF